jgi:sigma-B regulation protein RsbU (phosphoserine phosphatase)
MPAPASGAFSARTAALIVTSPSGGKSRVVLDPLPFAIGRSADSHFVLRDNRASRNHARIVSESGDLYIEDLNSSHGVHVNGARVTRHRLNDSDRIEFGVPDSYTLVFVREADEIRKILHQFSAPSQTTVSAGNLGKLRALVEVARALQNSLSTDDVLAAVVDAALAVTGLERGFLLLNRGNGLEVGVARDVRGITLEKTELQVPMGAIHRALNERTELLSMTFHPRGDSFEPAGSTVDGDIGSVICVPLVHVRAGSGEETQMISAKNDTIGLIYLDSRETAADLSTGNTELLQTLALEASTVLENARLLEEERAKLHLEEELGIAREIQASLLPRKLPETGWFRVAGSSLPSHQVGGDYFDVKQVGPDCWSLVVADVSGKGVSSALLAALLQGAFLLSTEGAMQMKQLMERVNRFLNERTEGEKYATLFFCMIDGRGLLRWANAGHCTPIVVRTNGELSSLETTGLPLGMLEDAEYDIRELQLQPGDKIIAYSDGLSEAQNAKGVFFEARRMMQIVSAHAKSTSNLLHEALMREVEAFTIGAEQHDDITAVVVQYCP